MIAHWRQLGEVVQGAPPVLPSADQAAQVVSEASGAIDKPAEKSRNT